MSYKPDISHYHPVRNWDKVKENCQVLITKATQGTTYIDPTLGAFVANCESRNIPYWLYEYINKGNEQAQTEFFWRVVQQRVPKDSKYFIGAIIDNEAGSAEKNVIKALRWLNDQGKKTMIYTMHTEYAKYRELIATRGNNCAWWEARYGANNGKDTSAQYPCHSGVDLHQYTSHGYCPGIPGSIDLNIPFFIKFRLFSYSYYTVQFIRPYTVRRLTPCLPLNLFTLNRLATKNTSSRSFAYSSAFRVFSIRPLSVHQLHRNKANRLVPCHALNLRQNHPAIFFLGQGKGVQEWCTFSAVRAGYFTAI